MVLVLGVGHPLMSDDALGLMVIDSLSERQWPDDIRLCRASACTPDSIPVDEMRAAGEPVDLIVIDALITGGKAGEILAARIGLEVGERPASIHEVSLAQMAYSLALSGVIVRSFAVLGIEAGDLRPGDGLSPAVARSLPRFLEFVSTEILRLAGYPSSGGPRLVAPCGPCLRGVQRTIIADGCGGHVEGGDSGVRRGSR